MKNVNFAIKKQVRPWI